MSDIEPFEFFTWKSPRILLDIRPIPLYLKGSIKHAISFSLIESNIIRLKRFVDKLKESKKDYPVHLIDQKGLVAEEISHEISGYYLKGGYAGFREWRKNAFNEESKLFVIGGYTGSGKTKFLQYLKSIDHQVIDLETLASHKGSAFGSNPKQKQPTHESFQNELLSLWLSFDLKYPIWIEEKGPFLGKAGIPEELQSKMKNALLIHLEAPFDKRLDTILKDYDHLRGNELRSAIQLLEDRMGMSQNHQALHFHDTGERRKCFELLLKYYDHAYEQRRQENWKNSIVAIPYHNEDYRTVYNKMLKLIKIF